MKTKPHKKIINISQKEQKKVLHRFKQKKDISFFYNSFKFWCKNNVSIILYTQTGGHSDGWTDRYGRIK